MIPRNQQNRKTQTNLKCPSCGMDLRAQGVAGFVRDGETYCCEGCANGTGCTCAQPRLKPEFRLRRGAIEQREPGETTGLNPPGRTGRAAKPEANTTPLRFASRKAGTRKVPKRKRSVTKPRDSSREQARGRSEFTGALNQGGASRVSRTGTKPKRG